MAKEEWRTQSRLYKGRKLALLPALIFALTFGGGKLLQAYSQGPVRDLGLMMTAFGFFTGLAAGSIGFSKSDAVRNVLGDKNFLIYSSRTLPVSSTRLMADFLVKDLVFYTFLYLLPVTAAAALISTDLLIYAGYMAGLFLLGLLISLVGANTAIRVPSGPSLSYRSFPAPPTTAKSVIDVMRSAGGLFKIVMSLGVLLGLYLYVVNYVPIASYLTVNPLLSFSVILGMMSVTAYNWLNTYDSFDDYSYLPLNRSDLLRSKFQAFKAVSVMLGVPVLVAAWLLYGGNIAVALVLFVSTALYVGSLTLHETGLNPNERMVDSWAFGKYLLFVNVLVIPLMALTSLPNSFWSMISIVGAMLAVSHVVQRKELH